MSRTGRASRQASNGWVHHAKLDGRALRVQCLHRCEQPDFGRHAACQIVDPESPEGRKMGGACARSSRVEARSKGCVGAQARNIEVNRQLWRGSGRSANPSQRVPRAAAPPPRTGGGARRSRGGRGAPARPRHRLERAETRAGRGGAHRSVIRVSLPISVGMVPANWLNRRSLCTIRPGRMLHVSRARTNQGRSGS